MGGDLWVSVRRWTKAFVVHQHLLAPYIIGGPTYKRPDECCAMPAALFDSPSVLYMRFALSSRATQKETEVRDCIGVESSLSRLIKMLFNWMHFTFVQRRCLNMNCYIHGVQLKNVCVFWILLTSLRIQLNCVCCVLVCWKMCQSLGGRRRNSMHYLPNTKIHLHRASIVC